jgi:AraC-like DNA-binding protein
VKTHCVLAGTNPPQFLSTQQIIARARHSNYAAQQLAKDLGLSVRTFERRFQRAFGCAPRAWLAEQRMRDALALLERGLTPKEAAAELFFDHPQSLFRKFRRSFGCTPVEYQRGQSLSADTGHRIRLAREVSHPVTLLSHPVTPADLQRTAAF